MQRAKDERKLLNKSFNETIDALVRNYDRIDPINSSPYKQRILGIFKAHPPSKSP